MALGCVPENFEEKLDNQELRRTGEGSAAADFGLLLTLDDLSVAVFFELLGRTGIDIGVAATTVAVSADPGSFAVPLAFCECARESLREGVLSDRARGLSEVPR